MKKGIHMTSGAVFKLTGEVNQKVFDRVFSVIMMKEEGAHRVQTLNPSVETIVIHNRMDPVRNVAHSTLSFPGESIEIEIDNSSQQDLIQHRHNVYLLLLVLNGRIQEHIGGHTFTYEKGSVCFLNENVDYIEQYGKDSEAAFVFLRKDFLKKMALLPSVVPDREKTALDQLLAFVTDENFKTEKTEKIYYDFLLRDPERMQEKVSKELSCIVNRMMRILKKGEAGATFQYMEELFHLFYLFWDSEYYYPARNLVSASQQEFLFYRIRQIISTTNGKVNRAGLSKALNYNGEYLNTIVRRYAGCTITELCRRTMLQEFCTRYLGSDRSVEEILEEMGITNKTAFFRYFREEYKTTPLKMKRGI